MCEEHMKHFKTCVFVQGVDAGNIPGKPVALTGGYDFCERYVWLLFCLSKIITFPIEK